MTTQISGTTGINRVQDGAVTQADLAPNVVGNGLFVRAVTSTQGITSGGSSQVVTFTTEYTDTDGCWNGSKFQPTVAGYYIVQASLRFSAIAAGGERTCSIRKNGSEIYSSNVQFALSGSECVVQTQTLIYLNGTTDYLEVTAYQASGSTLALNGSAFSNFFNAVLVRAA